jgi:pyrimidine operon attenuation protein/uracil phosphoribosyltransferase
MTAVPKTVLDRDDMRRTLVRIAHEVVEKNAEPQLLALVGIHRRGALLAARLKQLLDDLLDADVPQGTLDISFYRDDVATRPDQPVVHASHVPFDLQGRTVVIVDDVLFTGRTIRAAMEALQRLRQGGRIQSSRSFSSVPRWAMATRSTRKDKNDASKKQNIQEHVAVSVPRAGDHRHSP